MNKYLHTVASVGFLFSTDLNHDTLKALKDAIREEVAAIRPEMTNIAMENFRERLRQCIANNGRHLSDVIFKT